MKKAADGLMMIALFLAILNMRPAINSIAPILESIRKDLGMSAAVGSLLTSIPVLCMGLFSPVGALMGARYGIERVIGWSLVLIGVGTAMRLFTYSTEFMLLTTLIAGIGIAVIGPLSSGFIKHHFPQKVPVLIAIYTVSINVGQSLGSGLSAPLQISLKSWQVSLACWALLAALAVPAWWLFVIRRVDRHTEATSETQSPFRSPWGNPQAWLLASLWGLMGLIFYSITAWLPLIIQGQGYSKIYSGGVLTLCTVVQIPISLILPLLLKRLSSRLLWMLFASGMELIGFIMILFSFTPWMAGIFLGIGAGALFVVNLLLPIDATDTTQEAASWSAMIQSVGYVIGASGPILLGLIQDATQSLQLAVIGMIGFIVLMMAVQIIAVPRRTVKGQPSNWNNI